MMEKPTGGVESPEEGYSVKLEDLGPVIVNTDGTLGRIPNWMDMPSDEKAKTIRLVSTRNKRRLMELSSQKIQTGTGKVNLLDNVVTGSSAEEGEGEDAMKGSGSGTTTKTLTLEIDHH